MTAACQTCKEPFEPETALLPMPSGPIEIKARICPSCRETEAARLKAEAEATAHPAKDVSKLIDTRPPAAVPATCRVCGKGFESLEVMMPGGGRIVVTICDDCAAAEKRAEEERKARRATVSSEQRRRERWEQMTGTRYASFDARSLPDAIKGHVRRVMDWKVQPRGIGLVGPSRTGKSPLIYALGQQLYATGVDVFPSTGIEFQRQYLRGVERRDGEWTAYLTRCQDCAVLLLDDADKLNLTPGVEAEYYGMLEERRNWQRPVLCTLNLTGDQIKGLSSGRQDRSAAIVERLRDLCEFIPVSVIEQPKTP